MVWTGKNVVACFGKNRRSEIKRRHHASLRKSFQGCDVRQAPARRQIADCLRLEDRIYHRLRRKSRESKAERRCNGRHKKQLGSSRKPRPENRETRGKNRGCHHRCRGKAANLQKAEADQGSQCAGGNNPAKPCSWIRSD